MLYGKDLDYYKSWRDSRRREWESQYSKWMQDPNRRPNFPPSKPDLSVEAYKEHIRGSYPMEH